MPKIDTVGWDSVQSEATVIRIPVPQGTFAKMTYGSRGGNGMVLPRQGPIGGFFDDNTATLFDKCPPIILGASINKPTESLFILRVNLSEPLTLVDSSEADGRYYLQKRRDSDMFYFSNTGRFTNAQTSWTFSYSDAGSENEIHVGDYIRLPIGAENSMASDASKNFAGEKNPWVPVQGDIESVSFKVAMRSGVTSVPTDGELYAGNLPTKDETFRLSYVAGDKETLIASGKKNLELVSPVSYDTASYVHAGPTFDIDVEIPLLLQLDSLGKPAWNAMLKISANIYSNLGEAITKTSGTIPLSDISEQALTSDGKIRLRLEWLTHNGIAPLADNSRHIGTGSFISQFSFKAHETAISNTENGKYRKGQTKKQSSSKTKSFGFRRTVKK